MGIEMDSGSGDVAIGLNPLLNDTVKLSCILPHGKLKIASQDSAIGPIKNSSLKSQTKNKNEKNLMFVFIENDSNLITLARK